MRSLGWLSTEAGTILVLDIFPGATGSDSSGLANIGGSLFFGAADGVHGRELWKAFLHN